MESLPIVLPSPPAAARRPPLPFMAAIVPVAAGVILWAVTGSLLALCFAALGPLMLVASIVDSARSRRRERRQNELAAEKAWDEAENDLVRRHDEERAARWLRQPDVAACLRHPPLRGSDPVQAATPIVVGRGSIASTVRCTGGDDARGRAFRQRAARLADAPIAVPLGRGVCLRGPAPVVEATARGLIVQLCLRFGAGQLSLQGTRLEALGLAALPHAAPARSAAFRLAVGSSSAGEHGARGADAMIWLAGDGDEVPDGITTVIDVVEPREASLRTPMGMATVSVEGVSRAQAARIAARCVEQGGDAGSLPAGVALLELAQSPSGAGLPAAIGRGEREPLIVDIVEDGPHAIVTGTTGTGKSELLVTWVAAMAAENGPERVTFVLADFKGGTAFEPLRELRQVAAVITDLDDQGARRGVSSLTAELRRREAVLAASGARDVRDSDMPRLVIVIDEFAALLQEHPDLGAVFTDVAARGRALGMHLILGTQRATGVVRDALAANCPLRISLRVSDSADSRLVIGTDAAAELPGGPASRGLALVRRPADSSPVPLRVALTGASDLRRIGLRWAEQTRPRSPWLPPLPTVLPLAELLGADPHRGETEGTIVLGRADDPDHQSQPLEVLRSGSERGLAVIGAAGSGRSSALRTIAVQESDALWLPRDLEEAWDLVESWSTAERRPPRLLLCDDFDALLAEYPPEYAQQFAMRWEQVLRTADRTSVVVSAVRAGGPVARTVDALPRRALLRQSSRVDHLAAGGEPAGFLRDRPPGRARVGDREVQFAWTQESAGDRPATRRRRSGRTWAPCGAPTALVSPGAASVVEVLRGAYPDLEVTVLGGESVDPTGRSVVVGDAETWQRNWPLWQRIRAEGEVLVRAERPADLRQLSGVRDLPPYARAHAGRVWSVRGAGAPRRLILEPLERS